MLQDYISYNHASQLSAVAAVAAAEHACHCGCRHQKEWQVQGRYQMSHAASKSEHKPTSGAAIGAIVRPVHPVTGVLQLATAHAVSKMCSSMCTWLVSALHSCQTECRISGVSACSCDSVSSNAAAVGLFWQSLDLVLRRRRHVLMSTCCVHHSRTACTPHDDSQLFFCLPSMQLSHLI
jgi:hypothetical protein